MKNQNILSSTITHLSKVTIAPRQLSAIKTKSYISALIFIMCLVAAPAFSQIQLDSLHTTESTCPNNGSIYVYAKGSNPPLLYSIVAGPSLQPIQTGNIFNALPAGSYTVKISDVSGNSITQNTIIKGNYKPIDFNPIKTNPYCAGNSDGKLVGNLTANTGKGPFVWQLIAPSPVTSAPQNSDTFENLPAGNYTMRVTDSCGSFRTIVATLSDPVSSNLKLPIPPRVEIIGCDSGIVTLFLHTLLLRAPYTYKFETTNGTFITTTPTKFEITSTSSQGVSFNVQHILPGFTYGNFLKATITDDCGSTVSSSVGNARTFTFCPVYTSNFKNCAYQTSTHFNINNVACVKPNDITTAVMAPVTYQFIDVSTQQIIDSGTLLGDADHTWHKAIEGITIKPVPGNKTYTLIIKDGCGNIFQKNYTITNPVPPKPSITRKSISKSACVDSAASASIDTDNFKSVPRIVMLSGPSKMGSTKPGYSYQNTYSYPDTFNYTSWGGGHNARYNFDFTNLTAGTFHFKVIDSCGTEIYDSLVIKKTDLTNFGHKIWYKKGCLGKNQILFSANTDRGYITTSPLNIFKSYQSGTFLIQDSILNVPSGTYKVTFTYSDLAGRISMTQLPIFCKSITETITIEGYETPAILIGNSVKCKNNNHVVLLPDSTKGVPPYQYEIISGPQTFPVQNSNIFAISIPGTYTARIYDVCGNASTRQLFIDTISFTPISVVRSCNKAHIIYPTSPYYTYKWTRPNNTNFIGDRLIIDAVTAADTGTYFITKIINFNGCRDTLYASHNIDLNNIYHQNISICNGSTVVINSHTYNTAGIYRDTLINANGCDSIIQLNISVSNYKRSSIAKSICSGENITFGSSILYESGIYTDTLATATCDSIITLNLTINAPTVYLGKDTSICEGNYYTINAEQGYAAYYWNNNFIDSTSKSLTVNQTGKYWVTVKNNYGCTNTDTIEIVKIHPLPVANAGKDTTICSGETIQLSASGGHTYKWLPSGEEQATIYVNPLSTTSYTVTVFDEYHCGSSTDEVKVFIRPISTQPIFQNNTITHCFEDGHLTIGTIQGNTFLWSTGDTAQTISISHEGIYSVIISDNFGCSAKEDLLVNEYCNPKLYIPDAFSPNGDGLHDYLEIFGKYFKNFEMKIFNRWGEIIFISSDRNIQWDGTYRGEDMPIGTYPWIISYRSIFEDDTEIKIQKGSITLIR